MTTSLQAAFPARPLRILRHGATSSWVQYLLGLAALAAAVATVYFAGPRLLNDYSILQNPVVVANATMRNAKCKSRKAIFTDCEADIAYTIDGKRYSDSVGIFFIDVGSGSYSSGVVRSGTHPDRATLSLGIDYYWNRLLTAGGFAALMAALSALCLVTGLRNGRVRRFASGEPVALVPVPAQITKASGAWGGGSTYEFKVSIDGKTRTAISRFGKDEVPFQTADGTALAVVPQGADAAILMDDGLARLDLTDDERRKIWTAAQGNEAEAA